MPDRELAESSEAAARLAALTKRSTEIAEKMKSAAQSLDALGVAVAKEMQLKNDHVNETKPGADSE